MNKRTKTALLGLLAIACLALAGCGDKKEGLRITKLEPKVGPYTGGSLITIHGSGFESGGATGVKVYFGDKLGRRVVFEGDDKLQVEPPPGKRGESVDVLLIFDDGRKFKADKAYSYEDLADGFNADSLAPGKDE